MLLEILKSLIALPSSYPGEGQIIKYVFNFLKSLKKGKVTKQKVANGRYNILYEIGSGPALLVFGHLDTVSVSTGWRTNPYKAVVKKDKLFGLGAWDMKAGLAAILANLKDFQSSGFALKVAFVVDEENYSLGMHALIKSGWLRGVAAAISLEPGFLYGDRGICLGRVGRSVIDVNIKTLGGHTYLARENANVINIAFNFLQEVAKLKKVVHKNLGAANIFPRFIHAQANGMSIPDNLTLQLEVNMVPPQTVQSVFESIKKITQKPPLRGIKVALAPRPTDYCGPFTIDKDNQFVEKVGAAMKKSLKRPPTYYYRNSVADENRIAALGIPVVTVGPMGGLAHQANEWVSVKSLNNVNLFLKELLLTYNN